MTLQHFIIIFGAVQLLLSQLPNIHALRGLNLLSTLATLSFATVATAMSIVSGRDMDRSTVSYGLEGDNQLVLMSAFAALGTIAFRCVWGPVGAVLAESFCISCAGLNRIGAAVHAVVASSALLIRNSW